MISGMTIGRLSLYRRILTSLAKENASNIYSHQLAKLAGGTAAQVRRDVMSVGCAGSPTHGYNITDLTASISDFLDAPEGQRVALVGVGNLGRALLTYFNRRRPKLNVVACFDTAESKIGQVLASCPCYSMEELTGVIQRERVSVGVVTVPADDAQNVASRLCEAGVMGLLNFAPVRLNVPPGVHVENLDMSMSLEKVAYFARKDKD